MEHGSIASAASSISYLPQYEIVVEAGSSSSSATFHTTLQFQVENQGIRLIALLNPPRPCPIPIYAIGPSGDIGEQIYESIRATRRSGDASLFCSGNSESAVTTTTYRFGPNSPPRISLISMNGNEKVPEFEVISKGCMTRTVSICTHLGTFRWRYARRIERHEVGADNLVVMEQVTKVALENGKTEERARRVAQLVRNEEFRSQGSRRTAAGNGGRLMMDLRQWIDSKNEIQQMEVLIITSCIVMLKKEIDRRRIRQAMAMAGAGS